MPSTPFVHQRIWFEPESDWTGFGFGPDPKTGSPPRSEVPARFPSQVAGLGELQHGPKSPLVVGSAISKVVDPEHVARVRGTGEQKRGDRLKLPQLSSSSNSPQKDLWRSATPSRSLHRSCSGVNIILFWRQHHSKANHDDRQVLELRVLEIRPRPSASSRAFSSWSRMRQIAGGASGCWRGTSFRPPRQES